MGKVYKGQDWRLDLTTEIDLSSVETAQIQALKPDATIKEYTGEVIDQPNGTVRHDFIPTELDQAGDWVFWTYAKLTNDKEYYGEPYIKHIHNRGE